MTTLEQAARQALEALEYTTIGTLSGGNDNTKKAIASLRQAIEQAEQEPCNPSCAPGYCYCKEMAEQPKQKPLKTIAYIPCCIDKSCSKCKAAEQPKQEPVAWMCADEELSRKGYSRFSRNCEGEWNIPVYTTPPARKPLTDEQINELELPPDGCTMRDLVRIIERAHGIGEA